MNLSQEGVCKETLEREQEAYRIQWTVLIKAGQYNVADGVMRTANMLHCDDHAG